MQTRTRREVTADLYSARRKVDQLQRSIATSEKRSTVELSEKLLPAAERAVERLELELANTPEEAPAKRWEGTPPPPWPECIRRTMEQGLPRLEEVPDIPEFLMRHFDSADRQP